MPFAAVNPDFELAVRQSFARQSLMRTLGAELVRIALGEVDVRLACNEHVLQQGGFVHAGALASVADSACGGAALTLMPAGSDVVSVEFKLNLLAPARGEHIVVRARVIRAGRTLSVCSADVFAVNDGGEALVATMLGTMMRLTAK